MSRRYRTTQPATALNNTGEVDYPAGAVVELDWLYRDHATGAHCYQVTFGAGFALAIWDAATVAAELVLVREPRRAAHSIYVAELEQEQAA
jgi:hypothetical protein